MGKRLMMSGLLIASITLLGLGGFALAQERAACDQLPTPMDGMTGPGMVGLPHAPWGEMGQHHIGLFHRPITLMLERQNDLKLRSEQVAKLEKEVAQLAADLALQRIYVQTLTSRQSQDAGDITASGGQMPAAFEALADLEHRWQERRAEQDRLTLRAPGRHFEVSVTLVLAGISASIVAASARCGRSHHPMPGRQSDQVRAGGGWSINGSPHARQ